MESDEAADIVADGAGATVAVVDVTRDRSGRPRLEGGVIVESV